MNAFLLMIPLFLIRFGLLRLVNKTALSRAAFFAPLEGKEKTAYLFYEISNIVLIVCPLFLKVKTAPPILITGLILYLAGIVILVISTVEFAKPDRNGLNVNGIYKLSRNPMYAGYFLYYSGCAVLTHSVLFFLSLIIFQISTHWIILSEERWCAAKFGNEYINYRKKVRRYF